MAIQKLTYTDIPVSLRRAGAQVARNHIKTLLANPFLGDAQKQHLQKELLHLERWEKGQPLV